MDPWIKLAEQGPLAGLLGSAVVVLWKRLVARESELRALAEQARADQKEHSAQLLESSRVMDRVIRKLAEKSGERSISPFPRSSP